MTVMDLLRVALVKELLDVRPHRDEHSRAHVPEQTLQTKQAENFIVFENCISITLSKKRKKTSKKNIGDIC